MHGTDETRCISVDAVVFGAARVMNTCMAFGQEADIAAAMSVRQKILPAYVPVKALRKELEREGAILCV